MPERQDAHGARGVGVRRDLEIDGVALPAHVGGDALGPLEHLLLDLERRDQAAAGEHGRVHALLYRLLGHVVQVEEQFLEGDVGVALGEVVDLLLCEGVLHGEAVALRLGRRRSRVVGAERARRDGRARQHGGGLRDLGEGGEPGIVLCHGGRVRARAQVGVERPGHVAPCPPYAVADTALKLREVLPGGGPHQAAAVGQVLAQQLAARLRSGLDGRRVGFRAVLHVVEEHVQLVRCVGDPRERLVLGGRLALAAAAVGLVGRVVRVRAACGAAREGEARTSGGLGGAGGKGCTSLSASATHSAIFMACTFRKNSKPHTQKQALCGQPCMDPVQPKVVSKGPRNTMRCVAIGLGRQRLLRYIAF